MPAQFNELGLAAELLKAISEQGYETPTSIQEQVIPPIIAGKDLIAYAQTGTGKTAGYTLPMLHRISKNRGKTKPGQPVKALILTPTRELAAQVMKSVGTYGKYLPLKAAAVFGGVNIYPQIKSLLNGVDILVATPGRLLDHISQKTINLSKVEFLVLDEADRMLDMGFVHDIRKIIATLPKERQNLLFSATFSDDIKKLADDLFDSPKIIEGARRNSTAEKIIQQVYKVDNKRKRELLTSLISSENWRQVLVFTRTKHGANKLCEQLLQDGISSTTIHGNKSQAARTQALHQFKKGSVRVLVATDVAARGLDIVSLPYVVNFELPFVPEDYVHRIGRTGRAGNEGRAISLVCVNEHKLLKDIERLLKIEIEKIVLPGFEPDPSILPEVLQMGRQGRGKKRGFQRTFHRNRPRGPSRFGKRKSNASSFGKQS